MKNRSILKTGRVLLMALLVMTCLSTWALAEASKPAAKKAKAKKPVPPAIASVLEPKAMDILKACASRLAAAKSMSFTAVVSYESPSRLGPPLIYTTEGEILMQRPDKLRVITQGDGPVGEFYYNGKTMTGFAPAENLVAVAEAPPTIDDMVVAAYDKAAIYFPFATVIAADPFKVFSEGLTQAFYIGPSKVIGGTATDMVCVVNDVVFQQIWIGAEDKLPRMARAVFHGDPAGLRHQIEFSNWQIDPDIPEGAFASEKAAAAMPITFDRPDIDKYRRLPAGVKPPGRKAKPAEPKQGGAS